MALIKCKECEAQVDTTAKACPSCGAKVKRSMSINAFTGYAVLFFLLVGLLVVSKTNRDARLAREEAALPPADRAALAAKRASEQADLDKRKAERDRKQALENAAEAERACAQEVPAYVMGQEFVVKRLKAPSTAKFPYITDDGVQTQYVGDCTHKIVGYVDAQNGFGAMLRTRYYLKIKSNPQTDSWALLEIKINN